MNELTNINEQEVQTRQIKVKNTTYTVTEHLSTSPDAPTFKEIIEEYIDKFLNKEQFN